MAVEQPTPVEVATDSKPDDAGELQKPKRAASSYFAYTNHMRDEITKELKAKNDGKAKFGDIARAVKEKWDAMPAEEKKTWEDKAAAERERYAAEMKVYLELSDPAGTLRRKYENLIPKKPMSAYLFFCQDPAWREKALAAIGSAVGESVDHKQIISKMSEIWKTTTAEDKKPFEEKSAEAQKEFLQKQKEWQASPEFKEIELAEKNQEEKAKAKAAAEGGEPDKAAPKKRRNSVPRKGPKEETPASTTKSPVAEKTPKVASEPKRARKAEPPAAVAIDDAIAEEVKKEGLEGALRNLAGRPEIAASGKTQTEMLAALKASGGLVNPAKRALLGC